jgi:hypothetical protein
MFYLGLPNRGPKLALSKGRTGDKKNRLEFQLTNAFEFLWSFVIRICFEFRHSSFEFSRMVGKYPRKPCKNKAKFLLVLFSEFVKVTPTMKRLFTLIILLGLVIGAVTGCEKQDTSAPPAGGGTNAPATPPSTNK